MRSLLVSLLLVGCGPIVYINDVTRHASDSFERAKAAQADKYAPYYYTLAKEYLHQARLEAGRADFQGANRFGNLAREAADRATEDALAAAKDPAKRPLEDRQTAPAKEPGLAPAKE